MTFNDWIQTRWRPITAIVYLVICVFDFILFPILWPAFLYVTESISMGAVWDPLTLKGAGLFHLSFGAILGVSAYTRGQEKVRKIEYEYEQDEPTPRRQFDPPVRNNRHE
jgi:hypothetical protein